jgi:maltooligosyltrehalose trehalohydrolase
MLLLSSPFTPMLWMGEEWSASTPWQFFTSHPEPELGAATAEGRIAEFAEHGWDPDLVPDPQDPNTFARSKLDWSEVQVDEHAEMLMLYQALTALRRSTPDLSDPRLDLVQVDFDEDARWMVMQRGRTRVAVNLSDAAQVVPLDAPAIDVLLSTDPGFSFGTDLPGSIRSGPGIALPPQSAAIVAITIAVPAPQ